MTKGYTHMITFQEDIGRGIGIVTKSFRTTKDAVKVHLKAIEKAPSCFNVTVAPIAQPKVKLF